MAVSLALDDKKRAFFKNILGYSDAQMVTKSLQDLESDYYGNSALNTPGDNQRGLRPAAATFETFNRVDAGVIATVAAPTSGVLRMQAIYLPAGLTVNSISFVSGTVAGATMTHQWFGLFDNNRNALAFTSDDLATAWAASSVKTLNLTAPFVTTYSGIYYIGHMVSGTTIPTMTGITTTVALTGIAPIVVGNSTASLTTVPALPFTAAALTAIINLEYGYVS